MLDFARLKTPPGDGQLLWEPPCAAVERLLEHNRKSAREAKFDICKVAYESCRRDVRRQLDLPPDLPLLVMGHQPEFYHCGVWSKALAAQLAAARSGAAAVQFWIDYDKIKARALTVPGVQSSQIDLQSVALLCGPGEVYEQVGAQSAEQLHRAEHALRRVMSSRYDDSLIPALLAGLQQGAAASDWVAQYIIGLRHVDRLFDIDLQQRRAGQVDYRCFFAGLLSDASRFADCYNRALAGYRRAQGIKGRQHPVPNLHVAPDRVELPIWIQRDRQPRQRLYVGLNSGTLRVYCGDHPVAEFDRERMNSWNSAQACMDQLLADVRLRPRALAFTLWARMFVGDLFIHGIGGAKYDRITDRLIERYYGVRPPHYVCVSATVWLDLPRYDVDAQDVLRLRQQLREVQFNPQRFVEPSAAQQRLIDLREQLIAESRRLRRQEPHAHHRRQEVFRDIRQVNDDLCADLQDLQAQRLRQLQELERKLGTNQRANDREYFFCLHPRSNLARLQERFREQARGAGTH